MYIAEQKVLLRLHLNVGHIPIERNKLARAHPESNASPTVVPQIDTTFAFLSNIVSDFMYDRVRDISDQVLNIPRQLNTQKRFGYLSVQP